MNTDTFDLEEERGQRSFSKPNISTSSLTRVGNEFIRAAKIKCNNPKKASPKAKSKLQLDFCKEKIFGSKIPRKVNTAHVRKAQMTNEDLKKFKLDSKETPLSILNQQL